MGSYLGEDDILAMPGFPAIVPNNYRERHKEAIIANEIGGRNSMV